MGTLVPPRFTGLVVGFRGGGVQLPNILDDNSVEYISIIWKPHIDDCFIFYAHGEETLHRLSYPFEQFKDKIFIFLKEQFHMCEE